MHGQRCSRSHFYLADHHASVDLDLVDFCTAPMTAICNRRTPNLHMMMMMMITASAAWTITPKRTEHNLIVCTGKSEAKVTNNRRLCSMYCTVEANY